MCYLYLTWLFLYPEVQLIAVFLLVSWADLIAVAGAEAVALCGGPEIPVRLGRLDSRCNRVVCSFIQFIYIINQTLRDSILFSVFSLFF